MEGIHYPNAPRDARGFTLVELAIVLVIVGLLLGGVLQGRNLVAAAEYRSLVNTLAEYEAAYRGFRERYRARPGDLADAATRLGVGGIDGNGNGRIDHGPRCERGADESCRAWQQLRAAGLVSGAPGDRGPAAAPEHPFHGRILSLFTGRQGNGAYGDKLLVTNLPADVARRLADELDDGRPGRGRISCLGCTGAEWPAGAARVDIVYAL